MRQGQKAGLVGRGWQVDAAIEHGVKQRGEPRRFLCGERRGGARCARLVEGEPEERTDPHQVHREGCLGEHWEQQPLEFRTAILESLPA